uniref:Uncharacterized protein n=1 Tax=viral metagenome TaxID=1070528 RepID=A0A6H1ZH95_9ZZZZ
MNINDFRSNAPYLYDYLLDLMSTSPELFTGMMNNYTGGDMFNMEELFQTPSSPADEFWNVPGMGAINPDIRSGIQQNLVDEKQTSWTDNDAWNRPITDWINKRQIQKENQANWSEQDKWNRGIFGGSRDNWMINQPGGDTGGTGGTGKVYEPKYTWNSEELKKLFNQFLTSASSIPTWGGQSFQRTPTETPIANKTRDWLSQIFGR